MSLPDYAKPGPYVTKLSPAEEVRFQSWVKQNQIPWRDEARADYDMRGFFHAREQGDPGARRARNQHFPDKWKTPYHETFSNESIYAKSDAPHWVGDRLIDKTGKVVKDESKPMSESIVIIAPDGQAYKIPPDKVGEAILHGGKTSVRVAAPDGEQHWIPADQAVEALAHGGTIVRMDGRPYAKGQAPVVVGKNAQGQPVWGNSPTDKSDEGFLSSAMSALGGLVKGTAGLFDPRQNEFEKQHPAFNSPLAAAGGPLTRMVEPQIEQGERAVQDARAGNVPEAIGHGLAAVTPLVGPAAASVAEKAGTQVGEGDISGAAGTLVGNAAAAVAPEIVKAVPRAAIDVTRGRLQEIINPSKTLHTPVSPGDLTPFQRFSAARRMGVNLDRAQATNATVPKMAKRITEQSLGGSGTFERNNAENVQALHDHAGNVLDAADKASMPREAFGNRVQRQLRAHRNSLADEPGIRSDVESLKNKLDPRNMTREEFGDSVREALEAHRKQIQDKEEQIYSDLDKRLGDKPPDLSEVQTRAQGVYDQNKRFYENHPETLSGVDARVWKIVSDLARKGKEAPKDTWADLQRLRSHLLDLTRGNEFMGTAATGWAKQLTGAVDQTMTSADKTPGLNAKDVQDFRQANSLHKSLKETYDNPQSPFYWTARDEGMKAADRINGLSPENIRRLRETLGAVGKQDLIGQQQRQMVDRMTDPTGNGEVDLAALQKNWKNLQKESAAEHLGPQTMKTLEGIANRAATKTPYDAPGSKLGQIIDAPDGMAAARAMFADSGQLRLTPEEVRTMEQADPQLIPQLQRQAISRLFDPSDNGNIDLRNFSSRWNRAQKEPLGGVLKPDQMQDLNDIASVARTVNLPSNPSGTAVVLQPAEEAGRLARAIPEGMAAGVGAAGGAAVGGPVGAAVGAIAAPVAETLARGAIAKRLVNPDATEAAMMHTGPASVSSVAKHAATDVSPVRGAVTAGAAIGGNDDERSGVSTPPGGGEVSTVDRAEPNEVHDPAAAGSALQKLDSQKSGRLEKTGKAPSEGLRPADVYAGSSASAEAPEGATHEVLHPDGQTVLGHVVDGNYVPLTQ